MKHKIDQTNPFNNNTSGSGICVIRVNFLVPIIFYTPSKGSAVHGCTSKLYCFGARVILYREWISIGYTCTPRARLLNHWATKPEVCNQLVL